MKRILKVLFVLSLAILGLTACKSEEIPEENKSVKDDRGNIVFNSNKVHAMEDYREVSTYPGLDIFFNSFSNDQYRYSYFIPQSQSKKINKEIEDWLEGENKDFVKKARRKASKKEGKAISNYHMDIETSLLNKEEKIYSLIIEETMSLGGDEGEDKLKTFNFNLNEEKFYKLEDIVDLDREQILELALKSLENEPIEGLDTDLLEKAINSDDLNFSVRDGDLVLYFSQGQVGENVAGNVKLDIDFESIMLAYKEEGEKLLHPALSQEIYLAREENKRKLEEEAKEKEAKEAGEQSEEESTEAVKKVALTFDDGPHPSETLRLLDILDSYGAKATFFILGQNAEYYPDIVNEIGKRGHELANHSYSHADLSSLSYEGVLEEIGEANQVIYNASGIWPSLVRPPYGATSESVSQAIADAGMGEVLWSVDSADWLSRDPDAILELVQSYTEEGSIILMHDIHSTTIDSIPAVVEYLQGQGYELTTVSDL